MPPRLPQSVEPIIPSRAFPARLLRAGARDEARDFVAAADMPPATRRRLWRAWCNATMSVCRAEDLDYVGPKKPREHQPSLF